MKITNLLVVLSLFLLTACGGDENIASPEATIIGEWELQEFTIYSKTTTEVNGEMVEGIINAEGADLDYRVNFTDADFTTEGSYSIKGSLEVDGTSSTLDQKIADVDGRGTYSIMENELISPEGFFKLEFQGMNLDLGRAEAKAKIETLTTEELIFSEEKEETIEDVQSGVTFTNTIKLNVQSVWKRI